MFQLHELAAYYTLCRLCGEILVIICFQLCKYWYLGNWLGAENGIVVIQMDICCDIQLALYVGKGWKLHILYIRVSGLICNGKLNSLSLHTSNSIKQDQLHLLQQYKVIYGHRAGQRLMRRRNKTMSLLFNSTSNMKSHLLNSRSA